MVGGDDFLRETLNFPIDLEMQLHGHIHMDAINRENTDHYFNLLKQCLDDNDLTDHPECIYNMDETGVPLEPKPPKVVSPSGQRKIRYKTSGEKESNNHFSLC